jgi:hypothetical protein
MPYSVASNKRDLEETVDQKEYGRVLSSDWNNAD